MNMIRAIKKTVRGQRAVDGAGVHLVRVLGNRDVEEFDPFLMLDSFDSRNPEDYIKGFPMHPHRGIETISYLVEGSMEHQDSLGNKGTIRAGESQWMTSGSGIMHQEMPQAAARMLGLQLWLNLPRADKMTPPHYFDITADMIPEVDTPFGRVRVVSGAYEGTKGVSPLYVQATLLDLLVQPGKEALLDTKPDETVFVFLLEGDAMLVGNVYEEKTAILFGEGDQIRLGATREAPARIVFFSGKKLGEPIAWGGPIVMNTREELYAAFEELDKGTFIKHNAAE